MPLFDVGRCLLPVLHLNFVRTSLVHFCLVLYCGTATRVKLKLSLHNQSILGWLDLSLFGCFIINEKSFLRCHLCFFKCQQESFLNSVIIWLNKTSLSGKTSKEINSLPLQLWMVDSYLFLCWVYLFICPMYMLLSSWYYICYK